MAFIAGLREFNGEDDHAHLLVNYPAKVSMAGLVKSSKGVSSWQLRQEFTSQVNYDLMTGISRSPSYLAASSGGALLDIIRQYIKQQRHLA